jgi:hypothetical protein
MYTRGAGEFDMQRKSMENTSFGNTLTTHEQQIKDDYEWCLHDPTVKKTHGGLVVAVNRRHIWGVGKNHVEALQAALREPGCPPRSNLALVAVPDFISSECSTTERGEED